MTENVSTAARAFEQTKSRLLGFIKSFVSSREDAEDILQDVFYQFIDYSNINVIEKIDNWLFKTAKNKIIDKSRKKKNKLFSDMIKEYMDEDETFSIEDLLPSIDLTPEDLFLQDEFNEKFESALAELPQGQREVFLMSEVDGLSFKEISVLTGLTVNTLLSRKHYAAKQLKKKLIKYLDG